MAYRVGWVGEALWRCFDAGDIRRWRPRLTTLAGPSQYEMDYRAGSRRKSRVVAALPQNTFRIGLRFDLANPVAEGEHGFRLARTRPRLLHK